MANTIITYLQIFGIGFTFGIAGPCLLFCTPAILAYMAGTKRRWGGMLGDCLSFLSGRMLAYIILGYLAGFSASILKQFTNSGLAAFFKPAAGVVSIILGMSVIFYKDPESCGCKTSYSKAGGVFGLFIFGFLVGITPCAPLLALLFEIVLMSKTAFDGAAYALCFGLGTSLSGLVIMTVLSGILSWFPAKVLQAKPARQAFRMACAALLVILGISVIL